MFAIYFLSFKFKKSCLLQLANCAGKSHQCHRQGNLLSVGSICILYCGWYKNCIEIAVIKIHRKDPEEESFQCASAYINRWNPIKETLTPRLKPLASSH